MIFSKAIIGVFLAGVLLTGGCLDGFGRKPVPELCNRVAGAVARDNCFHQVAVRTGESVYCARVLDLSVRGRCYTDLAQGNTWASNGAGWD